MKKNLRRKGRISRWLSHWRGRDARRKLVRRHSLETLERRELLAGDTLAFIEAAPLAGEGESGAVASITPEIQAGSASVGVGGSFNVLVQVQDLRMQDPNPNNSDQSGEPIEDRGLFAISTDVTFDPALSGIPLPQFLGTDAAADHFGPTYANPDLSALDQRVGEGTIRITGAVEDLLTPPGPEQFTFATIPFKVGAVADFFTVEEGSSATTFDVLANDSSAGGTQTIATEYVNAQGQVVLFFVESDAKENRSGQGVAESNIMFATDTISVNVPGAPTLTTVSDPARGTASITDGSISYTPDANFFGTDTFTYTVTYPGGATDTATVTVTVNNTPDNPVAADDAFTTDKDTPLTRGAPGVLQNDTDPDIDPNLSPNNTRNDRITVTASDQTSTRGAAVTVNADGSFTYDPTGVAEIQALTAGQSLTDTFTYTISDKAGATDTATVTVTVTGDPVAQPAIDKAAFAQALSDAGVKFYGAAWCPHCTSQKQLFEDGQHFLPFIEVTNPDRTINQVGQQNNITTFPTWEFPDGTRATGVLSLETLSQRSGVAIPTASAPHLLPIQDVTLLAGAPLHIPLDGYDPNGTTLTYTVQVSGSAGVTATVLPQTRSMRINMEGYGDMVFRLFDNEVPRVTNAIADLAEDGVYDSVVFHRIINNFVIQGGDPTGTGFGDPNLPNFDDQFDFDLQHTQSGILSMAKAGDDTNSSQFFITERNPSNPRQLRSLDFNHSVFGMLVEGEDVRAAISDTATNSQDRPTNTIRMETVDIFVDEENGMLRLKAAPGAVGGTATITVTATDAEGESTQRTFNVTVQADPFNGGPFLSDIPPVTTSINTPVTFQLEANDVEGDPVRFTAVLPQGANPTFNFNVNETTGQVTVTPPQGFTGTLELLVGVRPQTTSDTGDALDTQLVEIEVLSIVRPDNYGTDVGAPLTVTTANGVLANDDPDNELGRPLTATLVNGPQSGQLQLNADGSFTYTPNAGFQGTDTFTYRASDGQQQVGPATVTIAVENAPTGASDAYTVAEDDILQTSETAGVLANDPNPNNQARTAVVATQPASGQLVLNANGSFTYTPNNDFSGTDTFTYRIRSGSGRQSEPITVTMTVTAENDPPVANNDSYTTNEGQTLTVTATNGVLANDTDVDGDSLVSLLVSNPQNGTLKFNAQDGSFTYAPNPNFSGTDTFTYRANDNQINSNLGTVTITVNNADNDPPVVQPLSFTVVRNSGETLFSLSSFTDKISDPDGPNQTFRVTAVGNPSRGGTARVADGGAGFHYKPAADVTGTETFSITIADQGNATTTATVTMTIQEFEPGSISGFVYLDHSSDGVLNDDEGRVGGVQVTLTGTTSTGATVNQRQVVTSADGSYRFDNLAPGTYTVRQTQPSLLSDGVETVGSAGGQSSTNDTFTVTLPEGVDATGYNFGEMRPADSFSILDFLAVKPNDSIIASIGTNSDSADWFVIESGWEGVADFDARLNAARTSATLNVTEDDGDRFRAQNVPVREDQVLASNSTRSLIRFFGDRSDFNFQRVTTTSAATQSQAEGEAPATQSTSTAGALSAEGESESDSPLVSQFTVGTHEASILDFLYTEDVTASSTTTEQSEQVQPQFAPAVDALMTELGEGEDAAPTTQEGELSLAADDDFHEAVDQVFEQDAEAASL